MEQMAAVAYFDTSVNYNCKIIITLPRVILREKG